MSLHVILNDNLHYRLVQNNDSEDYILTSIKKYKNWEPNVTAKFLSILEKAYFKNINGIVIDAGACFGYYSILAAKMGFKTYSFEPNPALIALLEDNVSLNQLNSLITVQKNGLGKSESKQILSVPENNSGAGNLYGSGDVTYQIDIKPLDIFELPENILLFKIDVEGHEADVISGSLKTIAELKAEFIFLEISPKFNPVQEIIHNTFVPLWELGYQSFDIGLQDAGPINEAIAVFQLFDKEEPLSEYLTNKAQTNFLFIRKADPKSEVTNYAFKQELISEWTNKYIHQLLNDGAQNHKLIGELRSLIDTLKAENHKLFEDLKNDAKFQNELLELLDRIKKQ